VACEIRVLQWQAMIVDVSLRLLYLIFDRLLHWLSLLGVSRRPCKPRVAKIDR
jgi:hypothetical protein